MVAVEEGAEEEAVAEGVAVAEGAGVAVAEGAEEEAVHSKEGPPVRESVTELQYPS